MTWSPKPKCADCGVEEVNKPWCRCDKCDIVYAMCGSCGSARSALSNVVQLAKRINIESKPIEARVESIKSQIVNLQGLCRKLSQEKENQS